MWAFASDIVLDFIGFRTPKDMCALMRVCKFFYEQTTRHVSKHYDRLTHNFEPSGIETLTANWARLRQLQHRWTPLQICHFGCNREIALSRASASARRFTCLDPRNRMRVIGSVRMAWEAAVDNPHVMPNGSFTEMCKDLLDFDINFYLGAGNMNKQTLLLMTCKKGGLESTPPISISFVRQLLLLGANPSLGNLIQTNNPVFAIARGIANAEEVRKDIFHALAVLPIFRSESYLLLCGANNNELRKQ